MTELINKEELMRRFEPFGREIPKDQVMAVLASIKEGVVRCGECKYWKRYDTTLFKEPAFRPCLRSGGMDSFTTWYDYCSFGERRDNERYNIDAE